MKWQCLWVKSVFTSKAFPASQRTKSVIIHDFKYCIHLINPFWNKKKRFYSVRYMVIIIKAGICRCFLTDKIGFIWKLWMYHLTQSGTLSWYTQGFPVHEKRSIDKKATRAGLGQKINQRLSPKGKHLVCPIASPVVTATGIIMQTPRKSELDKKIRRYQYVSGLKQYHSLEIQLNVNLLHRNE